MTRLRIDLETRSRVDLKKFGVYPYIECPDFRILMAGWAVDDEPIRLAIGHETIRAIEPLGDPAVVKVAHNAQFERVCLSTLVGDWLDPAEWHDTASVAMEYGYPASLEGVARALGAAPKDSAGQRLISLFCKPNRLGEFNKPEDYPAEWLEFLMYCEQDVETLRQVDKILGGWPNRAERDLWTVDQHINDTGMAIDIEMARLAAHASDENRDVLKRDVTAATGVANPGSVPQVSAWLHKQGVRLPNLQAETVEEALRGALPEQARLMLEARQELALAASSKYTAALGCVSADGRVRGSFRFFGAHTGRWSGRGIQPQNLPRLAFKTQTETDAAILDLKLGNDMTQEELKKLVRPLFTGPMTVVDYASIEARVIAWLAGEQWALDAFNARPKRDIYVETANRLGGLTRFQGKVAVLALGYQGGVGSIKVMSRNDEYLHPRTGNPVRSGALGAAVGGAGVMNMLNRLEQLEVLSCDTAQGRGELVDAALQRHVNTWRRANRRIVALWGDLQGAIENGGRVGEHLRITRQGGSMRLHLPSGRAIGYHQVRWEKWRSAEGKTKEGWRYADPARHGSRIGTYGGRLAENATQAVARDLLGEALVRLHRAGYKVIGHVHDEVIVEGDHSVQEIIDTMCQPPTWGTDLPIDGEGYVATRYRKG